MRTAVRNLRQREDIAKYLRNLDPDSAYYNGKSRTMKDNPNPDLPENLQTFKGDNWVKFTGDAPKIMQMEAFMIQENQNLKTGQMANTGAELNTVGMPSQMELIAAKKTDTVLKEKDSKLKTLLAKYGGSKHLKIPAEVKHVGVDLTEQQVM